MGIIFGSNGDSINSVGGLDFAQKDGKAVTAAHVGDMTFLSNGGFSSRSGGTIFQHGNGGHRSVVRTGNMWTASDGKNYTLSGMMLFCSDGRSWSGVRSPEEAERIIQLD